MQAKTTIMPCEYARLSLSTSILTTVYYTLEQDCQTGQKPQEARLYDWRKDQSQRGPLLFR